MLTSQALRRRLEDAGLTIPLPLAGEAFGIGRSLSYELAKKGTFPVEVIRVGKLYRVPTAAVLKALGLSAA
ncbi:MAG: hypothetical protein JWM85_1655 [Acidimicrobiaceae bacterium]|nr:hypothetical protein [Acidimicrobiaceae bacterium]